MHCLSSQGVLFGNLDGVRPEKIQTLSHRTTDGCSLAGFRVTANLWRFNGAFFGPDLGFFIPSVADFGIYLDRPIGKSVDAVTTFDLKNALRTTAQVKCSSLSACMM